MSDLIRVSLSPQEISLAPGASGDVSATVTNLSAALDQISLEIEGLDPSWVQILPVVLPIYPQEQKTARLTIRVPAEAPGGGPWGLAVRARSRENQGVTGVATLALSIQGTGSLELTAPRTAPVLAGAGTAAFPLHLVNHAAVPVVAQFSVADPTGALECTVEPARLQLGARAEGQARLTVRVRTPDLPARSFDLTVTAAATGAAPAQAAVHFAYEPPPKLGLAITPPAQRCEARAAGESMPDARFVLTVHNPGKEATRAGVHAYDPQRIGQYACTPSAVDIPAGGDARIELLVMTESRLAPGATRRIQFTVTAAPLAPGIGGAVARGELLQVAPAAVVPVRPPVAPPPAPVVPQPRRFPWWAVAAGAAALFLLLIACVVILQLAGVLR